MNSFSSESDRTEFSLRFAACSAYVAWITLKRREEKRKEQEKEEEGGQGEEEEEKEEEEKNKMS